MMVHLPPRDIAKCIQASKKWGKKINTVRTFWKQVVNSNLLPKIVEAIEEQASKLSPSSSGLTKTINYGSIASALDAPDVVDTIVDMASMLFPKLDDSRTINYKTIALAVDLDKTATQVGSHYFLSSENAHSVADHGMVYTWILSELVMNMSGSGFNSGMKNYPEWKVQKRLLLLHHSTKCPHEDGRCPVTPHCADMKQLWRHMKEKVRIRQKQLRLLLLYHSVKCAHENRRCPVTRHCAEFKRLWRHMEGCADNQCRVPHCVSSRAVIWHYKKCKDAACLTCGPVREIVRRKSQSSRSSSGSV